MVKGKCPFVSVVMPVHNYGLYIKDAIDSVLNQTMVDFEFIIVNDGSTDNSSEIAHSYNDSRIRIIDFTENRGCYPARNYGMRLAQGKYICVMDADDICIPERLELQSAFLEENTSIGLIGSAFLYMNDFRPVYKATDPEIIRLLLLRYCYILHPTCMIRHSQIKKHNLYYDENLTYASDYAWLVKASTLFPVSNVNDVLLLYREHEHQISSRESKRQGLFANQVRIQQLKSAGLNIKKEEENIIINFIATSTICREENMTVINRFVDEFISANKEKKIYDQEALVRMLNIYLKACKMNNEKNKS